MTPPRPASSTAGSAGPSPTPARSRTPERTEPVPVTERPSRRSGGKTSPTASRTSTSARPPTPSAAPIPPTTPAPEPERSAKRRRPAEPAYEEDRTSRGRRVTRVVRRIELWSILKLSIVLFFCLYLATLGALVAIWNVAYGTGQIDRLQSFLGDVGLQDWRFYGDRMFRAAMAIGAIGVLAGSVLSVLFASLVNVVSEITGGIRFSIIEERPRARRR